MADTGWLCTTLATGEPCSFDLARIEGFSPIAAGTQLWFTSGHDAHIAVAYQDFHDLMHAFLLGDYDTTRRIIAEITHPGDPHAQ